MLQLGGDSGTPVVLSLQLLFMQALETIAESGWRYACLSSGDCGPCSGICDRTEELRFDPKNSANSHQTHSSG
jgi:hypothetical protein